MEEDLVVLSYNMRLELFPNKTTEPGIFSRQGKEWTGQDISDITKPIMVVNAEENNWFIRILYSPNICELLINVGAF